MQKDPEMVGLVPNSNMICLNASTAQTYLYSSKVLHSIIKNEYQYIKKYM